MITCTSFDERILTLFNNGKPKDFNLLLVQVGFSHNTMQQHLRGLVDRCLIVKQKPALKAIDRPKFALLVSSQLYSSLSCLNNSNVELVGIAFSRLRHVNRFEDGEHCKALWKCVLLRFALKSRNRGYRPFLPIKRQVTRFYTN